MKRKHGTQKAGGKAGGKAQRKALTDAGANDGSVPAQPSAARTLANKLLALTDAGANDGSVPARPSAAKRQLTMKDTDFDTTEYPDGEPDPRPTSREQKHVFQKLKRLIPPDAVEKFEALCKSTAKECPGKEVEKNKIINAYVARDSEYSTKTLASKERTVDRAISSKNVGSDIAGQLGLGKWETIGTKYAGFSDLFEKARADGEVWQGEDGLWYSASRKLAKGKESVDETKGIAKYIVATDAEFRACIGKLLDDSPHMLGDQAKEILAIAATSEDNKCTDDDMTKLQNSFDAVTRLTLAAKRLGQDIAKTTDSETIQSLLTKGASLCKELVPHTRLTEKLLTTPKGDIFKNAIVNTLFAMEKPYKNLMMFYNDLVGLHKVYVGSKLWKELVELQGVCKNAASSSSSLLALEG